MTWIKFGHGADRRQAGSAAARRRPMFDFGHSIPIPGEWSTGGRGGGRGGGAGTDTGTDVGRRGFLS